MIEGLDRLLEGSGHPGLPELRLSLHEVLGGPDAKGRVLEQHRLKARVDVYRLQIEASGQVHRLVVKLLDPSVAERNRLAAERWLPAVGLGTICPPLLGVAADRTGRCVWHLYEDLGDRLLDADKPDRQRVQVAVELIARLHTRAAGHAVLPECRRYAADFGMHYFTSNVGDAIRGLEALRPPLVEVSPEHRAVRDRLLERLYRLRDEQPARAHAMAEHGGPETLLHGDLWTTNTLVLPTDNGLQARLIDWDQVGVGPASYDLSTFLYRFPTQDRWWILDCYREAVARAGWRLPSAPVLNLLFDTAECARYANRAVWPAVALLHDRADWGFAELAAVEQWFEALQPALPADDAAAGRNREHRER